MKSLQELQQPIDVAIVNAMIASTPEEWTVIKLVLKKESKDEDMGRFTHELISPEGHPPVSPEMSLYNATYSLDELMQSHNAYIKQATYEAKNSNGSWSYNAEFKYQD